MNEPTIQDEILKNEIDLRFTYHSPRGDQPERYSAIRNMAKVLALNIVSLVPESAERDIALRKLDEVVMYANAAIARREQ